MNGNTSKTTRSSASEGQQELPIHNTGVVSVIKRQLLDAVWEIQDERSLKLIYNFIRNLMG